MGQVSGPAPHDIRLASPLGPKMVEAVRRDSALSRVKLMMVTTESEQSQMRRALTAGANEYVLKPFTKDIISEKLRRLHVSV